MESCRSLERNDRCWCGSGKEYKKCHADFDEKLESFAVSGHAIPTHQMIKTEEQIEAIRKSAKIAVLVLCGAHWAGISTAEIDRWVRCAWQGYLRRWALRAFQRACVLRSAMRYVTGFLLKT